MKAKKSKPDKKEEVSFPYWVGQILVVGWVDDAETEPSDDSDDWDIDQVPEES